MADQESHFIGSSEATAHDSLKRYFLYGLFVVWLFIPEHFTLGHAVVRPVDFYILFFAYLALTLLLIRKNLCIPRSGTFLSLLALIFWGCISLLWAFDKVYTLVDVIQWVEMLVVFLLIYNAIDSWHNLRKCVFFLILLGVLLGGVNLGIVAAQQGDYQWYRFSAGMPSLGLLLASSFVSHSKRRRISLYLAIAICGAAIIFSLERHAWIGLSLAISCLIWLRYRLIPQRIKVILVIVSALLCTTIILSCVTPEFTAYFTKRVVSVNIVRNIQLGSTADALRFDLEKAAIRMGLDHPLTGVGMHNYIVLRDQYMPSGRDYARSLATHDSFATMFAELGFPGLAIWLCIVLQLIKSIEYYKRANLPPDETGLLLGFVGTSIYTLSELAFGSFGFDTMMMLILNLGLLGIIRKLRAQNASQKKWEES